MRFSAAKLRTLFGRTPLNIWHGTLGRDSKSMKSFRFCLSFIAGSATYLSLSCILSCFDAQSSKCGPVQRNNWSLSERVIRLQRDDSEEAELDGVNRNLTALLCLVKLEQGKGIEQIRAISGTWGSQCDRVVFSLRETPDFSKSSAKVEAEQKLQNFQINDLLILSSDYPFREISLDARTSIIFSTLNMENEKRMSEKQFLIGVFSFLDRKYHNSYDWIISTKSDNYFLLHNLKLSLASIDTNHQFFEQLDHYKTGFILSEANFHGLVSVLSNDRSSANSTLANVFKDKTSPGRWEEDESLDIEDCLQKMGLVQDFKLLKPFGYGEKFLFPSIDNSISMQGLKSCLDNNLLILEGLTGNQLETLHYLIYAVHPFAVRFTEASDFA